MTGIKWKSITVEWFLQRILCKVDQCQTTGSKKTKIQDFYIIKKNKQNKKK
jgi:hypothetical protein